MVALVDAQDVLQGGRGDDILLLDAQALALVVGVVGIEHPGDVLGPVLGVQGPGVILGVEGVEIQLIHRLALPQAQGADIVGAVADDGHVVGHGQHGLVGKFDGDGVVVAAVAPGIAVVGPVVGQLPLGAGLVEALLEQAELVAQAVAAQGQVAGHGAVQEAGRQAAQAAVAQGGVLDLLHAGQIHALLGEGVPQLLEDAEVVEVGIDHAAHQILGGEIVGLAVFGAEIAVLHPAVVDLHHHSLTQGVMQLLRRGAGELGVVVIL